MSVQGRSLQGKIQQVKLSVLQAQCQGRKGGWGEAGAKGEFTTISALREVSAAASHLLLKLSFLCLLKPLMLVILL